MRAGGDLAMSVAAPTWVILLALALPRVAVGHVGTLPDEGLSLGYLASWLPGREDFSSLGELYGACSGGAFNDSMVECFGGQVGSLLVQTARHAEVPVGAGVALVASGGVGEPPVDGERGQASVAEELLRKAADFVRSHPTVRVKLSEARSTYRKLKTKKVLLPFLVGVVMKIAAVIPLVLGLMTLLGLKAFFNGSTALGIITLLALHKLIYSGQLTHHKEVVHVAPTHYEQYHEAPVHYLGHQQQHPHQQQHVYQTAEAEGHSGPGSASAADFYGGYHAGGTSGRRQAELNKPFQQSVVLEPQEYKTASILHTH